MQETEHLKNLLIKSAKDSKRSVSTDAIYVGPRLGIKGASIQVIDSFIETVCENIVDMKSGPLTAQYILYADEGETIFAINDEPVDLPPHPVGDFFEAVPDLLITIVASTKSPGGLSPRRSDAIYAHDPDNEDDIGEIDVYISLPAETNEIVDYLRESRLELCGILTHEMQHVVQKMVCGHKLNSGADQDLMHHAFDTFEIDARVEEAITLMGDDEDELDEKLFLEALNTCINHYLSRNSTPDKTEEIKERMIHDHILAYRNKMHELL
jgi:hypothetical protein